MSKTSTARARVVGDAAWWVFIVASLIAGGVQWLHPDGKRYEPFDPSSIGESTRTTSWGSYSGYSYSYSGSNSNGDYAGWDPGPNGVVISKAYIGSNTTDWWSDPGFYSLAAFVIVVAAAAWEALAYRDVIAAALTICVPFAALAVLGLTTPGVIGGDMDPGPAATLILAVIAVGMRGWWARTLPAQRT